MASNTSNFVVPLPPVVKVEVEEQVVPKDFRGYLTRALAWTALMPLFMLAFMHFSQLTHTAAVIDDQQIMRTQQFARSISARFVSIETFLNTASDMISESIGSKVIPVSRLNKLAEKMPYLTSLKLISDTGSVDFHHGESSVSTAELMSAFAGSEVNVRSFQNEICFGSRIPEADSYDRSYLLIGCEPKEDIAAIFERSVGAEPYSLQIFDSKQKEIFFTSLNDSGNVRPQNLSSEFVKISEQMLGAPTPLWRTNQKRNDSAVLSIAEIPDTDWRAVFSQRVTFRDKQLLSSLLTSGVFLVCGALLALIVGTFLGFRLTNYVQTLIDQINAFKKDGSIKKPDRSFLANAPIELKLLSVQFEKLVRQVQSTQKKLEESNLDLTHQVNLRTRTLNQRNQELRALQLISVVAHELKTPVTTLRLQSETLQRQIRSGKLSDSQQLLTEMLEESERLQNLICDWLDVSRLEAGSLVIKPKVQTVTAILNKAMKSVHLHFPHLEVSLKVEPEAECVLADKDRMTQVFVNILENAARYNDKEKPTCNVRSEKIDDSVVISFSDNGIGVSEKHLSKIFDSFYQVDMGSGRKVGGTGLGLSICRGIMAAHGGKILAEQNPKGGTVFKISLSL